MYMFSHEAFFFSKHQLNLNPPQVWFLLGGAELESKMLRYELDFKKLFGLINKLVIGCFLGA